MLWVYVSSVFHPIGCSKKVSIPLCKYNVDMNGIMSDFILCFPRTGTLNQMYFTCILSHYDIVKLEIKYSAVRKEKFIVYYYTIYLLQYHSLKPSFIAHRLKMDFLISENNIVSYHLFVFLILKNDFLSIFLI